MEFETSLVGRVRSRRDKMESRKMEDSNKRSPMWNSSARRLFWQSKFRKGSKSSIFSERSEERVSRVQAIPPSPRSPLDDRSFQSHLAYSTESSHLDERDVEMLAKGGNYPDLHFPFFGNPNAPLQSQSAQKSHWPSSRIAENDSLSSEFFADDETCDPDEVGFFDTSTLNSFHSGYAGNGAGYAPFDGECDDPFSYLPPEMHRSFHDHYRLVNILGQGSYGIVYACAPLNSNGDEEFACKFISKSNLLEKTSSFLEKSAMDMPCPSDFCKKAIHLEVSAMKMLTCHPNIVQLIDVFEDSNYIQILLEHCNGGDLSEEVSRKGCFSESEAVQVFRGLMTALAHCHSAGVLHLDVKMENILLSKTCTRRRGLKSHSFQAKLADFGKAAMVGNGETVQGAVGSVVYMAPEVLSGRKYNASADIWSAGICLYAMLSGRFPWEDASRCRRPEFSGLEWRRVSLEAKVLIRKMLSFDPRSRPSAPEVLQHSWLRKRNTLDLDRDLWWNWN